MEQADSVVNEQANARKRVANVLNQSAQQDFGHVLVMGINMQGELTVLNAGLSPSQIVFMMEQFKVQLILGAPQSALPPPPAMQG